jgi:Uma2 family endonuclease
MSDSRTPVIVYERFSDLLERLGEIPPERIRLQPPPGTATEEDALHAEARYHRLCELIDGTLVEKTMGYYESRLAGVLFSLLDAFSRQHGLGFVVGESGLTRVEPGQLRMPDVAFYLWSHFPDRLLPAGQILEVVPDLAVEILSPANTKKEMARKRKEYFLGGTGLVWEVDPVKKAVRVYTAPDESKLVRGKGLLDGGSVLPGLQLSVADLFQRAGARHS